MEARASMSGWVDGGRRGSVIGMAEVEWVGRGEVRRKEVGRGSRGLGLGLYR